MDYDKFVKITKKRFLEKKWRFTSAPIIITKILSKTETPLSVNDIDIFAKNNFKKINLTTIYRVLDRLLQIGMIKKVIGCFMPTADPFQTKKSEHFMICERSGKAKSIFLNYHETIAKQLKKEFNFSLKKTDITFFGNNDYVTPKK